MLNNQKISESSSKLFKNHIFFGKKTKSGRVTDSLFQVRGAEFSSGDGHETATFQVPASWLHSRKPSSSNSLSVEFCFQFAAFHRG